MFIALGPYPGSGIDPNALADLFNSQKGGILGMFNMFSGGALSRFTIFALGIMPYISASIIMQLMSVASPATRGPQEGGGGRASEDHPIHPLRYGHPGFVPGAWDCRCA